MKWLIYKWHSYLDMPKNDLEWHKNDIQDEVIEFNEARGFVNKWSELSDVAYTYTRALWSGYKDIKFPFSKIKLYIGFLYMIPKYTLRWKFFRALGRKFDINLKITEVRNPKKIHKLENIAKKYNIDSEIFKKESKKLTKRWFFLD